MRHLLMLAGAALLAGCAPEYGYGPGYAPGYGPAYPPGYGAYGYRPLPQPYSRTSPGYVGYPGSGVWGPEPVPGTRAHRIWQQGQGTEVSQGN